MIRQFPLFLLAATQVLALSGCGGGGGAGVNSTSAPQAPPAAPPPPPPPPPPPQTAAVQIFPNVTVSTDFATIGFEASRPGATQTLTSDGFSVRFDAATGLYIIDLPSQPPGGFYQYTGNTPSETWWSGQLMDASGNSQAGAAVLKPSNPQLPLTYTTLAFYDTSGMSPEAFGAVAFGVPTPASAVPLTGTADYSAFLAGNTVDNLYYIRGSASLQFNFGSGTLTGHMDPLIYDMSGGALSLGQYTFTNTVFGVGSTGFSGKLSHPDVTGLGSFSGIFTGPNAQELMARWQAPLIIPYTHEVSQMFGVWVGKH